MNLPKNVQHWCSQHLDNLRLRLSHADAIPQLTIMGILSGLLAGLVIIAFRLLIESAQTAYMPGGVSEHFEALDAAWIILLPLLGGLAIGLLFQWAAKGGTQVGIVHVMERLAYHQGYLPLRNAVLQFVGAALSIMSGHSVGREGPSVHLGAAAGSLLGQVMTLPNNSIRTLVACGTAAAIAASFNTPLAGVIFAMEVVMMEYTISGFIPVILAAVSATTITRLVFGSAPAFVLPPLHLGSLAELPYILVLGLITGALAALFIQLLQIFSRTLTNQAIWVRMTLAGLATGLCALVAPEIMGIGYDTVNAALLGELSIKVLALVVIFKLLATTIGLGLGLPGGLIGPTIVIGVAAGGLMGSIGSSFYAGNDFSPAYYALLGMGAMMSATLQAPLAALTAMLELTANPDIILPGMLAVISANLASSQLFGKQSVYLALMQARGLDYGNNPVSQSLRRIGVASTMDRDFITLADTINANEARTAIESKPRWIIIRNQQQQILMHAADLARTLQELQIEDRDEASDINLLEIPAQRLQLASVHMQASLQEALEILNNSPAEALYVQRLIAPGIEHTYGILTRQKIESSYQ
jgi:H+/Cl- antiporter ClcA